jgi:YD repeat-containing protein
MKVVVLTIFLLTVATAHSQSGSPMAPQLTTKAPAILPPSPEAYQFVRYGNLPIGLNTGAAQFSLPVYTVRSGSLAHAISLGYSTNGIKVDEQPGRTGLGWNLRAGGVITRTVMDKPDGGAGIQPTYYHGSVTDTPGNWQLYNHVRQASYNMPPDFQPDEYSFSVDGLSGKFAQREDGAYQCYSASGVKITKTGSGFLITATNGTQYQFYLAEVARNYSYPPSSTLQWVPAPEPTAWYLTKIISANGADSIVFGYSYANPSGNHAVTYANGISQEFSATILNPDGATNGGYVRIKYDGGTEQVQGISGCANVPELGTTIQYTDNVPYCLDLISFAGGTVRLGYSDREDQPGEKKLDSIQVFRTGDHHRIAGMALGYVYSEAANPAHDTYLTGINYTAQHPHLRKRLFLAGARELGANGEPGPEHGFAYEDMHALPPRLSFAQDRHGAFNGKVNRQYFFPNDTWFDWHIGNNRLGADRSYSYVHAQKGALKKITYPTGGYTEIKYGPNKVAGDYAFKIKSDSVWAVMDTSTASGQVAWSDTIHHHGGYLRARTACSWASVPLDGAGPNGGYTGLGGSWYIAWYLVNVANDSCVKICGGALHPGDQGVDGHFGFGLAPGVYRLKMLASLPNLRARVSLERWHRYADHSALAGVAGIRVESLTDYTDSGALAGRRRYLYEAWGSPGASTGTGLQNDEGFNGREVGFTEQVQGTVAGGLTATCGYNTIASSSMGNNFLTDNGTVFYTQVTETATDATGALNNGGTEHGFYYVRKQQALPLRFSWYNGAWWTCYGLPTAPGAPQINNDFLTGMPKTSRTFTYDTLHGPRRLLTETVHHYSVDTPTLARDSFLVSRLARPMPDIGGNAVTDIPLNRQTYFYQYDMYRYWRCYGFAKLDSTVTTDYSGTVPMVGRVSFANHSLKNYLPRLISTTAANGNIQTIARRYAGDVMPQEEGYSNVYVPMVNANMVEALVEETVMENNADLLKKRLRFGAYVAPGGGQQFLPSLINSASAGSVPETELTYELYDSSGNLLQYTDRSQLPTAIIWGYNGRYPVAKVSGMAYTQVLGQSGINMEVVNSPGSEAQLLAELQKLHGLPGVADVVTRTYQPLIGIGTETPYRGRTLYYGYNAFGHLSTIKDADGNVVKGAAYQVKAGPLW